MNDKLSVKPYKTRFIELQFYAHDETLAKMVLRPQRFPEAKLCKILSTYMLKLQKNKLLEGDWHIADHSWIKTLNWLETLEPVIKWEAQEKKVLSNLIQQQQNG